MQPNRRFSIKNSLSLAFGSVAAMTVIACAASWLAFDHLSTTLSDFSDLHMPTMEMATRLAEEGGAVRATAPMLASADNDMSYSVAQTELERRVSAMQSLLSHIADSDSELLRDSPLPSLNDQIRDNLERLNDNVKESLQLARENQDVTERMRWLQADFIDEAGPLIDDARFNIRINIDDMAGAGWERGNKLLHRLNEESNKSEAVLVTTANANLLFGLLARSATAHTLHELEATTFFIVEVADTLEESISRLNGWRDTVTLRQLSEQLLELSSINAGLPALRRAQITRKQVGSNLLEENRNLVDQLESIISERIQGVSESAKAAAGEAENSIELGRRVLLFLSLSSLVVAVLVAWRYVHRNLLSRLTVLSDAARSIADGNLRVVVPLHGNDEITDMAAALKLFRDNAIQVEKENAQAIISNAVAGLLTTDKRGYIEFVNPVAQRLLCDDSGYFHELLPEQDSNAILVFFRNAIFYKKDLLLMETVGCRPDGTPVPLSIGIRPYKQRRRQGFIVTLTDITERRLAQQELENKVSERTADLTRSNYKLAQEIKERERAETELKETQEELVQAAKLAALGQVAAGVGHELNQPLAAIRSYSHNGRRLLSAGRVEEATSNFNKISDLTARMAKISNHLKRFARRPDLVLGPVQLRSVVDRALSLFVFPIREREIEVEVNIPENLFVNAEEIRLEQVFVNLISNALDAMRDNETALLRIFVTELDDRRVDVFVADIGPGISEERRQLVFDPFYTSKEVGAGLGLGLSISYNIVKDFQGELFLHSSGAEGTVFQVRLKYV